MKTKPKFRTYYGHKGLWQGMFSSRRRHGDTRINFIRHGGMFSK